MNPTHIVESSLANAWQKVASAALSNGDWSITPLVSTITEPSPILSGEDQTFRHTLDGVLQEAGKQRCRTVANTIFPASLYDKTKPRMELYARYMKILPALKKKCSKNRRGTYFERLIAYPGKNGDVNQLEQMIQGRNDGINRKSLLQVSLIDPEIDNRPGKYLSFPCLQQVCFTPDENGQLHITAMYAYQFLVERWFGNLWGLISLGSFVADQVGLELATTTCVSAYAKFDMTLKATRKLRDS